jgi:WXG100 family type VII secretion target
MSQTANEMGQGHGTLTKAAGLVEEARIDFDNLSKTLDGQIADLKGKWNGAGGQAFMVLHASWTEKHKFIVKALNDFEQSLRSTEKDNTSTDDNVAGVANSYASKLDVHY